MVGKPSKLRILHCAETIKGGIATYLRELLPLQCATYGAENILILIPVSQKSELPVPTGVRVETYADAGGRVANSVRLAMRALKIARREHVSIAHVHSSFAGFTVRPVIFFCYHKAKIVYCAHGWAWDRPMSELGKLIVKSIERWLTMLTNKIVCISEHDYRTALSVGVSANKLVVVKNAVSSIVPVAEKMEMAWPDGKLRVLFVGRLDRQKGVDVLLDALKLLGDKVHAVIAGASVVDSESKPIVFPSNVTRIGWLLPSQLESLFSSAQVLVVPSRWEGFGLIATEAMRAGLPVVASNVGGLPEVIEDGVTGVIVPPESPQALANTIGNLDEATLKRMGNAGRARVAQHFTMERLHRELCAAYDDVSVFN